MLKKCKKLKYVMYLLTIFKCFYKHTDYAKRLQKRKLCDIYFIFYDIDSTAKK